MTSELTLNMTIKVGQGKREKTLRTQTWSDFEPRG